MGNRIHVMQVTFGMDIGGMERVIMDLCRYINPSKYRFTIVCISVKGRLAGIMEEEGVPVIFCKKQDKMSKYLRGTELAKIFRKERPDIIHTHHTPAFIHSTIGKVLSNSPILINTDHCKNYNTEPRLWMHLEKMASYFTNEIIAVSNHTKNDLIKYENISPNKLSVIYNGLNLKTKDNLSHEEIKKDLQIDSSVKVIGSIGRLAYQKGYELLIEAMPYILKAEKNIKFVIVGGGSEETRLRELARELNIEKYLIITGWRNDAINILQVFDVFVSTSRFEGMPMVLLEAMASKKPIISTKAGGVPEVISDNVNGILLKKRCPHELSDAILKLIKNDNIAYNMGQYGYSIYEKNFTAEVMAKNYESVYEKYLQSREI